MVVNKLNNELLFKITGGYQQLETLDLEIKNKSENYLKKARQLQNQGQLEEAIATYQQVIKINPDFYQAYINLGEILSEQEIVDEAISCYRRALELKPNDIYCYRNLQQLLINYYRSFDNSPKTVEDYCSLGKNLISQKKWEDAIACFLLALQIKPSYRDAYQQIGNILQQQGLNNFAHPCYHGKLPDYLLSRLNLCEKTRNWEVTSTSETNNNVTHLSIYPATTRNLLPPSTINTNIHPNFKNQNHSLEAFVAIVPNGRAWGDNSNSAVITSENQLLSNISTGNPEIIMSSKSLPPIHHIDGKVVFISGLTAVQNYYHWMIDVLPRIELLRHSKIDFNSIDKFVFNRHGASYHKETLDYLGISQNKVMQTWQYPHIKATELVVPSAPFRSTPKEIRIPKWVCKFLKKKFLEENLTTLPKASKRIYISRGSSSRKVVNEEQFMQVLARLGFELVTFESMSVFEQAALMAEAEIVVAPHGAGLANLVFCSPGTKVIELFSPAYVNICYWILSNQCNLEYYYLMGENRANLGEENASQGVNPGMSSQDIWVNIDSFLNIIKFSNIIKTEMSEELLETKLTAEDLFKTGNELRKKRQFHDAIKAYTQAIEINPKNAQYHCCLGEVLTQINQLEEANTYYCIAQKLTPNWFKPHYNIGVVLEKKGDLDAAIISYEKAIELNPNFSWSYYSLADILTKKGLLDEAVKSYESGIKFHNNRDTLPSFYMSIGELLSKQEKLDEAISTYHTLIQLDSTQFGGYYQKIGILYKKQQNFSEATNYLVKALQYSPGDAMAYYEIADLLEKQGLFLEAELCYNKRNLPINIIEKYYQSVNNWSVININNLVYNSIHPPTEVSFVLPKAFDDNIHYSVNQTKANTRETFIISLQDGRAWSDGSSSAIITSDNQVVADVSTGGFHIVAASQIAEPTYNIDGVVAFLSAQFSIVPNYCHWMFDILPRIELLRLNGIDINSIDKFVMHRFNETNFQKETLSCLGIDQKKIIDTYQHHYIKASKLLIPSILAHPCNVGGKWAVEFLRKSFLKESTTVPDGKQKKRLYISRKSTSKRRIINEELIQEFLNKYGFETVVMDSLSVLEQASLLANAEAVISAHGANLTNIVFCNPGTKVIEIFSPMYGTDAYFTISNLCSLEYYNLIGKDFDNSQATIITKKVPNAYWGAKDIYVEKNDLLNLLKFAGLT